MKQETVPISTPTWVIEILRKYGYFNITEDLTVKFTVAKGKIFEKDDPEVFENIKEDIPNIDYLSLHENHIAVFDFPGGYLESYGFKFNNDKIEIIHNI